MGRAVSSLDDDGLSIADWLHGHVNSGQCRWTDIIGVRAIGDGQFGNGVSNICSTAVLDGESTNGQLILERCWFGEIALGSHCTIKDCEVEVAAECDQLTILRGKVRPLNGSIIIRSRSRDIVGSHGCGVDITHRGAGLRIGKRYRERGCFFASCRLVAWSGSLSAFTVTPALFL